MVIAIKYIIKNPSLARFFYNQSIILQTIEYIRLVLKITKYNSQNL